MINPREAEEYKKVKQKVDELTEALKEAKEAGLNISVIQKNEVWTLPDGSKWPYGRVDLPEVTIQGFGYTFPSK